MGFPWGSVKKYKDQDYNALRKESKTKGTLFIDPEFPPDDRSLSSTSGKFGDVIWKRPKSICENPRFFVEGASAGDVTQGRLGNCWFVAASSCLASVKEIWHKVIPDYKSQEWDPEKPNEYCGIFRFQFWHYGQWVEVVIDDMLPTINNELIFIHSQSRNEFWSALLEKAYAKLFGNYESLDGGELCEALEDFTGGVSDTVDLIKLQVALKPEERVALFARMQKEIDRRSLMVASIPAATEEEMEAATDVGLVKGHAYGITAVKKVHLEGSGLFKIFNREKLPMIRLRNPWGQCEWKGAFSDGSPEWKKITKSDRQKIGLVYEEDGEFWMTFEDFCRHFHQTAICRVVNTSLLSMKKTWYESLAHGAWRKPDRAGGCSNNTDTFPNNPQYVFDVNAEEEFMVQLMQKNSRNKGGALNKTIGFVLLRVDLNRKYRIHDVSLQETVKSTVYQNSRSIFLRHGPETKGRYVVIPSTFEADQEGQFLLRVYTSSSTKFRELTRDAPTKRRWNCCARGHAMVTQVKVVRAIGLAKKGLQGGDVYCVLSCEGQKAVTRVEKNTNSPEWGDSAVFYRKNPLKHPIKITIWNNNLLRDEFMGRHLCMSTDTHDQMAMEVPLVGRKKDGDESRPGKLLLRYTQSHRLTTI